MHRDSTSEGAVKEGSKDRAVEGAQIVWKPGEPCYTSDGRRTGPYYIVSECRQFVIAKVTLRGEARFELWRGKKRYPDLGTLATANEARALASKLLAELGPLRPGSSGRS